MRVIATMSWGDVDLGHLDPVPAVGDTVYNIDDKKDGKVARRVFERPWRKRWYGGVRREWVCRLFFEGLP